MVAASDHVWPFEAIGCYRFCLEAHGCMSFPGYPHVRNLKASSYDSPGAIFDRPNSFVIEQWDVRSAFGRIILYLS